MLAVIIVLAIIALIATPVILNLITRTSHESIKASVMQIKQGAETFDTARKMMDPNYVFDIDDYSFKGEQFGKGTEQPNIIITIEDKDLASIVVFKDEKCYYSLAGEDEVTEEESSSRGECLSHVSDILPPEIVSVTPNTTEWVLAGIYLTVEAVDNVEIKDYSFDGGATWQTSNISDVYNNATSIEIQVRDLNDNVVSEQVEIESKTEYGYQEVSSWSSEYTTTVPTEGYYTSKTQYGYQSRSSASYSYQCGTTCRDRWYNNIGSCPSQCTSQILDYGTGCQCLMECYYKDPKYCTGYNYGSWGTSTGWTTSGAYEQTTSRKPVTRTTIRYAG